MTVDARTSRFLGGLGGALVLVAGLLVAEGVAGLLGFAWAALDLQLARQGVSEGVRLSASVAILVVGWLAFLVAALPLSLHRDKFERLRRGEGTWSGVIRQIGAVALFGTFFLLPWNRPASSWLDARLGEVGYGWVSVFQETPWAWMWFAFLIVSVAAFVVAERWLLLQTRMSPS